MSSIIGRNGVSPHHLDAEIEHASAMLNSIVGSSEPQVEISWNRPLDGNGQAGVKLTLSDYVSTVETTLTTKDLRDDYQLEGRLLKTWSKLLNNRSEYHLRRVRELVNLPEES